MTVTLLLVGAVIALTAAARSTWSPCGLSMLSSITPFGERGRRHRYGVTAAWYLIGATVGGAVLGGAGALLAVVARAAGLGHHPGAALAVAGATAAAAAAIDAGLFGPVLPLIRRQVDDAWLARYRPWVYGAGFGWQIGVGLATYLMTAGVVLVPLLGALSASAGTAVALGALFGLARGSTVFLTARATGPGRLRELHGRLDRLGPGVRWSCTAAEGLAAVVLVALAAGYVPGGGAGGGAGTAVGAAAVVAAGSLVVGFAAGRRPASCALGATGPVTAPAAVRVPPVGAPAPAPSPVTGVAPAARAAAAGREARP